MPVYDELFKRTENEVVDRRNLCLDVQTIIPLRHNNFRFCFFSRRRRGKICEVFVTSFEKLHLSNPLKGRRFGQGVSEQEFTTVVTWSTRVRCWEIINISVCQQSKQRVSLTRNERVLY